MDKIYSVPYALRATLLVLSGHIQPVAEGSGPSVDEILGPQLYSGSLCNRPHLLILPTDTTELLETLCHSAHNCIWMTCHKAKLAGARVTRSSRNPAQLTDYI